MEEKKFAQLDQEQLEKINALERQIGVTLVAYDSVVIQQGNGDFHTSNQDQHSS